jgi:hypothetical protein
LSVQIDAAEAIDARGVPCRRIADCVIARVNVRAAAFPFTSGARYARNRFSIV